MNTRCLDINSGDMKIARCCSRLAGRYVNPFKGYSLEASSPPADALRVAVRHTDRNQKGGRPYDISIRAYFTRRPCARV